VFSTPTPSAYCAPNDGAFDWYSHFGVKLTLRSARIMPMPSSNCEPITTRSGLRPLTPLAIESKFVVSAV
jgi:hypothetical protein